MTRITSTITLYKNTGFDDTYKHIVRWQNKNELEGYLATLSSVSMEKSSYQNLNKPIRWDSKIANVNELAEYEYIKIYNPQQKGNQTYFAFITNLEYMNDGTTFIYYSIDNWNTYFDKVDLTKSTGLIKQAFIKDWNSDHTDFTPTFKLWRNNSEEIGGDGAGQLISSKYCHFHRYQNGTLVDNDNIRFCVFVTQPKDASKEKGELLGAYSQYKYWFFAYNIKTGWGLDIYLNNTLVVQNGNNEATDIFATISKDPSFVGTSSLVVDCELVSTLGFDMTIGADKKSVHLNVPTGRLEYQRDTSGKLMRIIHAKSYDATPERGKGYIGNGGKILQELYNLLRNVTGMDVPAKLLGKPYTQLVLTNGRGVEKDLNLLRLNDGAFNSDGLNIYRMGTIGENQQEFYYLPDYNTTNQGSFQDNDKPSAYTNSLIIDDTQKDVPVILDSYTMFLNSNRNQLANTRANAKMNMLLAKEGSSTTMANLERTQAASRNALSMEQANQSSNYGEKSLLNIAKSGIGGVKSGGVVGGLLGVAGGAITAGVGYDIMSKNQSTATAIQGVRQDAAMENQRANNAYQNKVATNNYEQTLRSQQAVLADTRNQNDSIAHQGGKILTDVQTNNGLMRLNVYTCQAPTLINATLYFNLFGYTINSYSNISSWLGIKKHFDYIKTGNVNVSGDIPHVVKNTLAAMFDNGVTMWNSDNESRECFSRRDIYNNTFL